MSGTHRVLATKRDGDVYLIHGGASFSEEQAKSEAAQCTALWPEVKFEVVPAFLTMEEYNDLVTLDGVGRKAKAALLARLGVYKDNRLDPVKVTVLPNYLQ